MICKFHATQKIMTQDTHASNQNLFSVGATLLRPVRLAAIGQSDDGPRQTNFNVPPSLCIRSACAGPVALEGRNCLAQARRLQASKAESTDVAEEALKLTNIGDLNFCLLDWHTPTGSECTSFRHTKTGLPDKKAQWLKWDNSLGLHSINRLSREFFPRRTETLSRNRARPRPDRIVLTT